MIRIMSPRKLAAKKAVIKWNTKALKQLSKFPKMDQSKLDRSFPDGPKGTEQFRIRGMIPGLAQRISQASTPEGYRRILMWFGMHGSPEAVAKLKDIVVEK